MTTKVDPHPATASTSTKERRGTLRVLIVDDLPEIRFLLEVALSREPKIRLVGQAEDGVQVLEKVELLRPDLVVMDMEMPRMGGIEATRRVVEKWPDLAVVGYTSAGHPEAHDAMVGAGAVESFDNGDMKGLRDLHQGAFRPSLVLGVAPRSDNGQQGRRAHRTERGVVFFYLHVLVTRGAERADDH